MADLSNLVPKKNTVDITIKHPTTGETLTNDDGSDMTVTVYAPFTREYRSAGFAQANQRLKGRKNKQDFDFTFEELEDAGIELLVDVTTDWNITFGGKKPKFSKEKAREVYKEIFWLKAQIEEAINTVDFMNL